MLLGALAAVYTWTFSAEVPPHWIGKKLHEIDTRRYGVIVLAVHVCEQDTDAGYQVPDPEHEFRVGDVVVLAGTLNGLERVRTAT